MIQTWACSCVGPVIDYWPGMPQEPHTRAPHRTGVPNSADVSSEMSPLNAGEHHHVPMPSPLSSMASPATTNAAPRPYGVRQLPRPDGGATWAEYARRSRVNALSCWPRFNLLFALAVTTVCFLVFLAIEQDTCSDLSDCSLSNDHPTTAAGYRESSAETLLDTIYARMRPSSHSAIEGRVFANSVAESVALVAPASRDASAVGDRKKAADGRDRRRWRYPALAWLRRLLPTVLFGKTGRRRARMATLLGGPTRAGALCTPMTVRTDITPGLLLPLQHGGSPSRLVRLTDDFAVCSDRRAAGEAAAIRRWVGPAAGVAGFPRNTSAMLLLNLLLRPSDDAPTRAAVLIAPGTSAAVVGAVLAGARRRGVEGAAHALHRVSSNDSGNHGGAGFREWVRRARTSLQGTASGSFEISVIAIEPEPTRHRALLRMINRHQQSLSRSSWYHVLDTAPAGWEATVVMHALSAPPRAEGTTRFTVGFLPGAPSRVAVPALGKEGDELAYHCWIENHTAAPRGCDVVTQAARKRIDLVGRGANEILDGILPTFRGVPRGAVVRAEPVRSVALLMDVAELATGEGSHATRAAAAGYLETQVHNVQAAAHFVAATPATPTERRLALLALYRAPRWVDDALRADAANRTVTTLCDSLHSGVLLTPEPLAPQAAQEDACSRMVRGLARDCGDGSRQSSEAELARWLRNPAEQAEASGGSSGSGSSCTIALANSAAAAAVRQSGALEAMAASGEAMRQLESLWGQPAVEFFRMHDDDAGLDLRDAALRAQRPNQQLSANAATADASANGPVLALQVSVLAVAAAVGIILLRGVCRNFRR
jgi:hypothetical protein